MADELTRVEGTDQDTVSEVEEEVFDVTFRNGALKRIKKVASELGISDDNLEEVLKKGIVLMDIAKDGNYITVKKGKDEYLIDLRTL